MEIIAPGCNINTVIGCCCWSCIVGDVGNVGDNDDGSDGADGGSNSPAVGITWTGALSHVIFEPIFHSIKVITKPKSTITKQNL